MNLKVIIVDDEESGREILKELLNNFCTDIEILDTCVDVESAVKSIKLHKPNLVFLDVEMPNYAGYELVDFFDQINFQIIFVTAYDQYALKAFQVAAIDYLLKPVDISILKSAVNRARSAVMINNYKEQLVKLAEEMKLSEFKISYLDKGYRSYLGANEIIALEANRAYTKVYLMEKPPVIIGRNLSSFEEELNGFPKFWRTHRSWLINADHISSYSKTKLEIILTNGVVAKLSKHNKDNFEENIQTLTL